jgi:cell surface protein SprA
VGFISLTDEPMDDEAIAVAYRIEGTSHDNEDDQFFGEFSEDMQDSSILVLKLVKPMNLSQYYYQAWKLQLRNIYSIGSRYISRDGFTAQIYYKYSDTEYSGSSNGIRHLQMFGLDMTDESGASELPDGLFDFNDRTIRRIRGDIIFPVLEPFGKDLPEELPESMSFTRIYDRRKDYNSPFRSRNVFVIRGKFNRSEFGK